MHPRPLLLCLLAVAAAMPGPAGAQEAPPPARVGRVAAVTGPVSFHLAGAVEWQLASRNLPVTTGTALAVGTGGEAALGVADDRIVLGSAAELDVDQLDDAVLAATQPGGESYWHLRTVMPGETFSVRTPRGVVTIATAGRYAVDSGDVARPTTVTVLDGAATLAGGPTSQEVGAGQTVSVTGDGAATPFTATIGPAAPDAFLRHVLAEEAPSRPRAPLAPAVLAGMTGAEALYDTGEWVANPEYGPVWYPPTVGYVPYRQGHWAFVAPWGWTWVDDAPWGFAPSHYGRWASFDGRWGWVPGRDWGPGRQPVYAPALVGFFGGAALGAVVRGVSGPLVGWAPLGPRDAYRPSYPVDDRRLQVLNGPTNATVVVNTVNQFIANRNAVTVVPQGVLTGSTPVAAAWRGATLRDGALPPAAAAAAVQFQPQTAPTRATVGVTNAVLRQVNPAGLSAPATHVGPGPRIGPAALPAIGSAIRPAVGPGFSPGIGPAMPPLRERDARAPGVVAGPAVGEIVHPRRPLAPGPAAAGPAPSRSDEAGFPHGPRSDEVGFPHGPRVPAVPRVMEVPQRPELPHVRYGGPPPGREPVPEVRYGRPEGRAFAPPPLPVQHAVPHAPPPFRPEPAPHPPGGHSPDVHPPGPSHGGGPPHGGGERHER